MRNVDIAEALGCGVSSVVKRRAIYLEHARVFCSACGNLLEGSMVMELLNVDTLCRDCWSVDDPDVPLVQIQARSMLADF